MPALLTTRSTCSVACAVSSSSRNRSTCASSATSQAWLVTTTPGGAPSRATAAVSATASAFRSQAATEHPCAASWRTSSRPMPEPPPVTTASLPENESIVGTSLPQPISRSGVPGRHGYPVQVVSQHDLTAEDRRRLAGQPPVTVGAVLVALREVGEDEQPHPALRRDLPGLPGGHVPVVAGQRGLGVGEGGLADQHVRPVRQREGRVTQPGVHDEREPLARPRLAHLLQRHR